MPLSTSSIYRVVVTHEADDQALLNVLDYKVTSGTLPGPTDTIQQFLNEFRTAWRSLILDHISAETRVITYVCTEIRGISKPDANTLLFALGEFTTLVGDPVADQGTLSATNPLPTYAAVGIRKITGFAGKANRGSMRIGVIPEAETVFNTVAAGYLSALQADLDIFTNFIGTGTFQLRLVVFPARTIWKALPVGGTSLNVTGPSNVVTSMLASQFITSQVSRKRRAATLG